MVGKEYIIERITEEQILHILSKFGAEPYKFLEGKKEIWFQTICHGGDSHKLCYFRETKTFYCYTNCGQMSLFNLIMKLKKCTFAEAVRFIEHEIGINNRHGFNHVPFNISKELSKIDRYIQMRKAKETGIRHLQQIEDGILGYFEHDIFYTGWIDEGISINTMQYFGVCWYELEKHIIIPHYNIYGGLVGIRRRSLQEKDKDNKYMPETIEGITYTHPLNLNLYGLDKHLHGIRKTKKAMIVESEKSVMLAHDYYGKDAFVVATCGFNISNWHRDVLLSLGVEEIFLAFDRDYDLASFGDYEEDGLEYKKCQRYIKRINMLAMKLAPYFTVYILYDYEGITGLKSSPLDYGKDIFEQIMKQKIEMTTNTIVED